MLPSIHVLGLMINLMELYAHQLDQLAFGLSNSDTELPLTVDGEY